MSKAANIWLVTKKILVVTGWFSIVVLVCLGLYWSNQQNNTQKIKETVVSIYPTDIQYYNKNRVMRVIDNQSLTAGNASNESLNLFEIEQEINNEPFVKQAQVYTTLGGKMNIKIIQRRPLIRMFRYTGESYMIDETGIKIPVSEKFTPHVLVANGNIFERYKHKDSLYSHAAREVYKIATHVDKDEFLKAQIEQIFVEADNEFILVPKLGKHLIYLGTATDLDEKFNKLKLFYKEGLNKVGWSKYKGINLKYKNQVVCTK